MTDFELPDLPSDEELGIEPPGGAGERPAAGAPDDGGEPPEGASTHRPSSRWRGPVTLLALASMAWLSSPVHSMPDPAPATAPDAAFSSARAMVQLVELARRAHPPGSPEHTRVRERIMETLRELSLEPTVQTTTAGGRRGGAFHAATVRNIVARLPGTEPTGAVLVTAHYDGRTISPAAADDGVGVVSILESVRALQAGPALRNDVIVLLTDAEELGLLGARAFVREHPWMDDVSVVLSLEMRGGGGPSIMFETGAENGWVVEAMKAGDPAPVANSLSYEVYRRLPNDTDFTPFRQAGKQGLNFAAIGRGHVYHQTFDTPENVQEETVQHHGIHLLGMLRELGNRDLAEVNAPDRVFFRLPVVGLVTYGMPWIPLLGVVLLLGTVAVTLWSHRRGAGAGSLAWGFVLGLLSVGGSGGVGWLLFRQVRSFHPEYGLLQGSAFHSEGWYVLAGVAVAFALVTGLLGVARRRGSLPGLATGALMLPVLLALYLTFAAPLGAMNLQWPALAGVVGVALVAGLSGSGPPGLVRWLILLLVAPVVLAFMSPLVELVWTAMNVSILPVLAGLAALTLLLLLPLLDALAEPNRWWAPVVGLVLAAVFVAVGLLHSRPSPERPTPSTLAWTLDRESGDARWISRPGPGLPWARERAGALDSETGLEGFMVGQGPFLAGPAPGVSLETPEVATRFPPPEENPTVTGEPGVTGAAPTDSAVAGSHPPNGQVRVALRSRIGAERMTVTAAPGSEGLRWRTMNGRPVEGGARVRSVTHWGTPEGALLLDFEPPPGADSVRLVVVEHHLRPGELVGEEPFRRPPDLVPAVGGISDRALVRSVVTIRTRPGGAPAGGGR